MTETRNVPECECCGQPGRVIDLLDDGRIVTMFLCGCDPYWDRNDSGPIPSGREDFHADI